MDVVYLPLLPKDTQLTRAITAMDWHQKSGVVMNDSGNYSLLTAGRVIFGLAQQLNNTLENLQPSSQVHILTPQEVNSWKLDTTQPTNTQVEFQNFFNSIPGDYCFVDYVPGLAMVVTRHETEAKKLDQAPKGCYCDGKYEHPFLPPPIPQGSQCNQCGGTIHCR